MRKAFTLHPYKTPSYLYKTEIYLRTRRIQATNSYKYALEMEVGKMEEVIQNKTGTGSNHLEAESAGTRTRDDALKWTFTRNWRLFTHKEASVRRRQTQYEKDDMRAKLSVLVEWMNKNKKDYKQTVTEEIKQGPLGPTYLVDMIKHIDKWRGDGVPDADLEYIYHTIQPRVGSVHIFGLNTLEEKLKHTPYAAKSLFGSLEAQEEESVRGQKERVNLVVPLCGKTETFERFLKQLEESALKVNENVSLTVVYFLDGTNQAMFSEVSEKVKDCQTTYPEYTLQVLTINGTFQRADAFQLAAAQFNETDLLFLVDVDCQIERPVFHRIRTLISPGEQVYFPIMFSEFSPEFRGANTSSLLRRNQSDGTAFVDEAGFWRMSSYGQVALYKSDLDAVGGFNTNIKGWGKEDTDFFMRVLKKKLTVFRSDDPGIIHIFHSVQCDPNLPEDQHEMCLGSKWATFGSVENMSAFVYNSTFDLIDLERGE